MASRKVKKKKETENFVVSMLGSKEKKEPTNKEKSEPSSSEENKEKEDP